MNNLFISKKSIIFVLKTTHMKYKVGFKFKPTFNSNIDFFEVRGIDESRDMVLTIVHPKTGFPFNDEIERVYYDSAFFRGDYIAIK